MVAWLEVELRPLTHFPECFGILLCEPLGRGGIDQVGYGQPSLFEFRGERVALGRQLLDALGESRNLVDGGLLLVTFQLGDSATGLLLGGSRLFRFRPRGTS